GQPAPALRRVRRDHFLYIKDVFGRERPASIPEFRHQPQYELFLSGTQGDSSFPFSGSLAAISVPRRRAKRRRTLIAVAPRKLPAAWSAHSPRATSGSVPATTASAPANIPG